MGATHFLMKTLPRLAAEMALHVLAYNIDPRYEHHGCSPAPGGNEGIIAADMRPSAIAEPPRMAGISIRSDLKRKNRKLKKITAPKRHARGRQSSMLATMRFYTTKTHQRHGEAT